MHRPSGTPALHAAQAAGLGYALVEVQHSEHQEGGYALDTARVLERDPSTIFKTLMAKVDGDPVCAVVPASGMLNLKALARAVGGKKACMMQAKDAERLTGYVTGGISPLGQRTSSPIVIDESARELPTVLVSGGRRDLSIDVSPMDLAAAVRAHFAPIADAGRHT